MTDKDKKLEGVDYWEDYFSKNVTGKPIGDIENVKLAGEIYWDRFLDETSLFSFLFLILILVQVSVGAYVIWKIIPYAIAIFL